MWPQTRDDYDPASKDGIVCVCGPGRNLTNVMATRTGPLARKFAWPEEVSAAVLYLASGRAEFVTGQIMRVDGGTLL